MCCQVVLECGWSKAECLAGPEANSWQLVQSCVHERVEAGVGLFRRGKDVAKGPRPPSGSMALGKREFCEGVNS